jgi:hypothetical protein
VWVLQSSRRLFCGLDVIEADAVEVGVTTSFA